MKKLVVLIDPPAATVALGQTQQFQASVSGTTITAITFTIVRKCRARQSFTASLCAAPGAQSIWDVNGVAVGNATFGTIAVTGRTTATFTAPQNLPSPNSITIHAIAGAATASAAVTMVSNIQVSFSPPSANLNLNQRQLLRRPLPVQPTPRSPGP